MDFLHVYDACHASIRCVMWPLPLSLSLSPLLQVAAIATDVFFFYFPSFSSPLNFPLCLIPPPQTSL